MATWKYDLEGVPVSSLKAKLTVVLKADEVVVAETENGSLWQQVLAAINAGATGLPSPPQRATIDAGLGTPPPGSGPSGTSSTAIDKLSQQLAVDVGVIQGACDPKTEEPYLHLDPHNWEAMRSALPERGPTAISPVAFSATLLGLWFRAASLGNPTQSQAQAVLQTINVRDQNASRGIQRTSWLQSRAGGQVVLNPAEVSKAVKLMKAFCSKDWSSWLTG
jgi:hypothetical protein